MAQDSVKITTQESELLNILETIADRLQSIDKNLAQLTSCSHIVGKAAINRRLETR
jgi:hypothetical protein